ncbi:MAG: hypothetical protein CSA72_00950 [Rhodobacterales bacterium]|nr:MAG: hypothetical protein CSA72_00950 [Rhodobacterales bacterium]
MDLIFRSVSRALDQIGDPRFRSVMLRGIGITLAALIGLYALTFWGVGALIGDGITLPWIGTLTWVDTVASWGSLVLMLGLSVFLMVPIAQAVQSLFLEDIADAVESRHYPHLPPAQSVPLADALLDGLRAFAVLVGANILALALYVMLAPLAPVIFYGLNGFLLGREYFQVAALRRVGAREARRLRRRHIATIWAAGVLMALPLTIPVLNLLIPVLGAASFTHIYHGLTAATARSAGAGSPDPRW